MKLGLYDAILHDRPLADALAVVAANGLTGIELNTGGFLPPVHVPDVDAILEDDEARDAFLAQFAGPASRSPGSTATATRCTRTPRSGRRTPRTSGAASDSPPASARPASSPCRACPPVSRAARGRTGS